VVVVVGLAVTTAPVVPDKPVPGAQLYVLAPLAVRTTLLPEHIEGADGLISTIGLAFTVTVTVVVPVQPARDVPVTVYVVVVVGLAVTTAPVVPDNPVAGAHT
jgi:hypothetical protein